MSVRLEDLDRAALVHLVADLVGIPSEAAVKKAAWEVTRDRANAAAAARAAAFSAHRAAEDSGAAPGARAAALAAFRAARIEDDRAIDAEHAAWRAWQVARRVP